MAAISSGVNSCRKVFASCSRAHSCILVKLRQVCVVSSLGANTRATGTFNRHEIGDTSAWHIRLCLKISMQWSIKVEI